MALTLTLLAAAPDALDALDATDRREPAVAAPFRIGRAPDNDWTLPDPERHLSKRHCEIAFRDGEWRLTDLSTNGTFLNREAAPIGPGGTRELRDGDRLRLGGHAIGVRITPAESWSPAPFGGRSFAEAPFGEALFGERDAFAGPVRADHTPAIEDAFVPPAGHALLPEDWDLDLAPAPDHGAILPSADPLAAFLRGAGLPALPTADPTARLAAIGAAFRVLVHGLRAALAARAAVKGAFRIGQTLIRPRGNNPLKAASDDDAALAALLGGGEGMAPATAIGQALADLRRHELATQAAMQAAARALLAELSPAALRAAAGPGLLPAAGKLRAWDAFEAAHGRLSRALADASDNVFARAFAQAYERAAAEAGDGEGPC